MSRPPRTASRLFNIALSIAILSATPAAAAATTSSITAAATSTTAASIPKQDSTSQSGAKQADGFSSAEAGFKISKPVDSWVLNTQPGPHGISALAMGPLDQAGKVQFAVSITAAAKIDFEQLRDQTEGLLKQVEAMPGGSVGKLTEIQVAGLPALNLELEQDALGSTFKIQQVFLLSQGLQYKFQAHASKDSFSKYEKDFAKALNSFQIVPLAGDALLDSQMRTLAARCGSEVEWINEWQEASDLARKEDKLIVVAVQSVTGFDVGDEIGRGPFMDMDVVRLLKHRFVVLRWRKGMGAPFENYETFGMGPSTFGSGLLVVTPDGEVNNQLFLLRGTAVYDVLIDALQVQRSLSKPKATGDSSRQERIEFLLYSGQLIEAKSMLAINRLSSNSAQNPVREAWLNFELHRLLRNGDVALNAIQSAIDLSEKIDGQTTPSRARMLLSKAGLLAGLGSAKSAEALVEKIQAGISPLNDELQAEALMLHGSLRLQDKDRPAAERLWKELMQKYPENRWAWLVAAAISGPGWSFEIYPDLRWPKEEHRRLAKIPAAANTKGKKADIEQMIEGAADYMLAVQKEDGSWVSATGYGDHKDLGDDFDIAATAIGGRALLRLTDRTDAQNSAERAMQWLMDQRIMREQQAKAPVVFMDYAVWSRSYCIFFLADCLDAGLGDQKALRVEIQKCLDELAERQQPNGGWSYYLSGTAGGAAIPQAISFTTATVVMALERAAQVDCFIKGDALDRGLRCLENLRSPAGTFAYFLHGRDVEQGTLSGTSPAGSAARGPACALALLRGDREKAADLIPRFELYAKHLPGFGIQRRKALMHAGPDTQGSHYLLYDYSTAAEALLQISADGIPSKLHKKVHAAIMLELRACQNMDGSFVDNPLIGVDSATGLAISALLDLQAALHDV